MKLKTGDRFFVRVDQKIEGKKVSAEIFASHLNYVEEIAAERTLLGGGFANIDGGMLVFRADSYQQAEMIAAKDPLIAGGLYSFKLYDWELKIVSEQDGY